MGFPKFNKGYSPVSAKRSSSRASKAETAAFLSASESGHRPGEPTFLHRRNTARIYWALTALNILFFLSSLVLTWSGYRQRGALIRNENNELIRLTDWYSPVHDQVQIGLVDVQINGTLLNMNNDIFRQPPSPEVDAAWERIGSLLPHPISTEDVIKLGKDPSKTARFTEDFGFGPDAHVAEVDVLHTIHCLNAIRRDVHWQHYFAADYPDGDFPPLHKVHTDHCIYVVLQNLMCSATVDLVTEPWVEGQLTPFPDFSVNKKCRDFGAILRWHEETAIKDVERYERMRMPLGHVPYRMSDEFKQLFGYEEVGGAHGGHDH